MPMNPIANLIATSDVTEAVNQPMNTPTKDAGQRQNGHRQHAYGWKPTFREANQQSAYG